MIFFSLSKKVWGLWYCWSLILVRRHKSFFFFWGGGRGVWNASLFVNSISFTQGFASLTTLQISDTVMEDRFGVKHGSDEWYEALDQHFKWLLGYRISPYFCRQGENMRVLAYTCPWPGNLWSGCTLFFYYLLSLLLFHQLL